MGSAITVTFKLALASISLSLILLSFNKRADIDGDTIALTSPVLSLLLSSSINLNTAVERVLISCVHLSFKEDLSLCLESSRRPNLEILPICTLALSAEREFRISSSTFLLFSRFIMSIKSITTRPPISLSLNCLDISLAASRLVCVAVSSISLPEVAFDEFMSIATRASASSMTIDPPDSSFTSL